MKISTCVRGFLPIPHWKSSLLHWISLLLLGLMSSLASAGQVATLPISELSSLSVGRHLTYLIDSEAEWSADQLAQQIDSLSWQQSHEDSPNLGLQEAPVWFAVRLLPATSMNPLLEIGYPALDLIDLYLYRNGQLVQKVHTGDHRPFSDRVINHRHFVMPLELQAEQPHLLLIRVQTGGSFQVPITLWESHSFYSSDQYVFAAHMVFTGLMLALAIYNFLVFVAVRESTYLWYVAAVIGTLFVQLGIRGISYQFLWPQSPSFNDISLPAIIALSVIAAFAFAESFLRIRETRPAISRLIRAFIGLHVLLFLYALFAPYSSSIRLLILSAFVSAAAMFIIGLYLWRRGEVLARFYVIAWSMFLVGNVLHTMSKAGILPYYPLFEYAVQIGASLEVLLLSLALAYRINFERRKRQAAQAEALRIQRDANERLEARVQERTAELEKANERLELMSQMDGLTQVKNRKCFDQTLETEWRRHSREIRQLSLLMIDADHFKRINDTWGHLCGDACLQHLATVLRNSVQRAGDIVARYGGEEFVLLLPATSLEGAATLAERIRQQICEQGFTWKGERLPLTVSIGVSGCTPDYKGSFEMLIQQADEALYAAKSQGRNQVVTYQAGTASDATPREPS